MKLRKNLKIFKTKIGECYDFNNEQFYEAQAKVMRKYLSIGWSVHEWLLHAKCKLLNHLHVVEELVPTTVGVSRRKLEGIFSPENEFSLNWAENMYEILKREVPEYQDVPYKKFMELADLSMVDCENPPKQNKIDEQVEESCNDIPITLEEPAVDCKIPIPNPMLMKMMGEELLAVDCKIPNPMLMKMGEELLEAINTLAINTLTDKDLISKLKTKVEGDTETLKQATKLNAENDKLIRAQKIAKKMVEQGFLTDDPKSYNAYIKEILSFDDGLADTFEK